MQGQNGANMLQYCFKDKPEKHAWCWLGTRWGCSKGGLPVCEECIFSSAPVSKKLHKRTQSPFTKRLSTACCRPEAFFTLPHKHMKSDHPCCFSIPPAASPRWDTCPQTHPSQWSCPYFQTQGLWRNQNTENLQQQFIKVSYLWG